MFTTAIEEVSRFSRPIHFVERRYDGQLSPGTSTLFFVNEHAVAVTCRHVVQALSATIGVCQKYEEFKRERALLVGVHDGKKKLLRLEQKFDYKRETVVQARASFISCVQPFVDAEWRSHETLDLAIVKFSRHTTNLYESHAYLARDSSTARPGRSFCRLGYPFPEFTNFQWDQELDNVEWTKDGVHSSPRFPIDGMMTRSIGIDGQVVGIELSTPGLRGQSGGPLFDSNGTIFGVQSATNHLHLGFDMKDKKIVSDDGRSIKVTNQPFLHVGNCIHVDVVKEFLREHGVKFYER